jgi:hypothetical protein
MNKSELSGNSSAFVGLGLVALGLMFLLGQFLRINFWGLMWPFFIIVPGLLFFAGMLAGGKSAGPLAIPGSIITMVGGLLLYQNLFNHYQSWSYAWALVFPTALGVGFVIEGLWSDHPHNVRTGRQLIFIGLVLFAVFAIFFELIINLSGFRSHLLGRVFFPLLLIGLGAYLVLARGLAPLAARPKPLSPDTQVVQNDLVAAPPPSELSLDFAPAPPPSELTPADEQRAEPQPAA